MPQAKHDPIRSAFLVFIAMSACGKDVPKVDEDISAPAPAPDVSAADTAPIAAADTAPRPRSDPPPRPPLPEGIQRFDKDAITLALSGEGRYLAGGDLSGRALLWDLSSGRFLWGDPIPAGRVGRVFFAEASDVWIGGSFDEPDRPWRAWAAGTLERRGEFGTPNEVAIDLALDRKGETAVVLTSTPDGSGQTVAVWKLTSDRPIWSESVRESRRGAVAISTDGTIVAVSDDRGGLMRFALDGETPSSALREKRVLAEPSNDAVPERVARLAWLDEGPQAGLWAAIQTKLVRYAADTGEAAAPIGLADDSYPIRGLHRVARDGATSPTLVAVTRPEAGGLTFWGLDGQALGELVTECRCEIHALSFDGKMAACGCTPASEIRYGPVRWR